MSGGGSEMDFADDYDYRQHSSYFDPKVNCTSYLMTSLPSKENLTAVESLCIHAWHSVLEMEEMGNGGTFTPWWSQVIVQILYGLVCLIGLGGNTLVIYVVVRYSKMQTVTNLYIVNLAIADECFLVGIPFLMTTITLGSWPFGSIVCKAYFTSTSINQITSSLFLLIMSADRYLAVCHPISAPKWRTPLIAKTVALTAWTLSALLMVPIFMYANTLEVDNKVNCNIFWPESRSMSGEMIFIIYSFVLGFAVPLVLILVFYVMVIRKLRTIGPKRKAQTHGAKNSDGSPNIGHKDGQQLQQQSNRAKERKKSHRKVTKLVLTVITVYFICWAPYWATQMALIFMPQESSHSGTVLIIFLLAGCLSYSNSTMNPILYAFLSENFKKSFKKACHCASEKEINATLNPENSVFPRKKSSRSYRQRKSSAPLTSATYAGTGMETTTMATRSTVVPSPHIPSPMSTHVPVSKLIPDIDDSTSDNMMTAVVITAPMTEMTFPTPPVHIIINDHCTTDDNYAITSSGKPATTYSDGTNTTIAIGSINETFVQDNGVVVTAL